MTCLNFRSLCYSGREDCCDQIMSVLLCDIQELPKNNFVPMWLCRTIQWKTCSINDVVEKDLQSINLLCLVDIGINTQCKCVICLVEVPQSWTKPVETNWISQIFCACLDFNTYQYWHHWTGGRGWKCIIIFVQDCSFLLTSKKDIYLIM